MNTTQISKLISLVLRHHPERLGLALDAHGWADTSALIDAINAIQPFDMEQLEAIVRADPKQRYAFSPDKSRIRANQGHSIPINLELIPRTPPVMLWHGTGERFVSAILREGLKPMDRQYVHLSADPDTAVKVGRRHGGPALFTVDAARMAGDGLLFYRSENGVWLTDEPVCQRVSEAIRPTTIESRHTTMKKGRYRLMKKLLSSLICFILLCPMGMAEQPEARLLYQGHGSLRIVTAECKVIYIDPYAGEGYDLPADLILVSHGHHDHTAVDLIKDRADDCRIITYKEALVGGEYKTFDLGYATVEAVQAGNNPNHDINMCVGWLVTLSDDITVYATGDTSATEQMAELAERDIDYALFCCDGKYNMDIEEAGACATLVNAKHSIPYHMSPGKLFDADRAAQFDGPGKLIIAAGEEIILERQ